MRPIRIAYIGGGSKLWARSFMQDLALDPDLTGEVALYDIDVPAAERNRRIGTRIHEKPEARSKFVYTVAGTLEEALTGADFVLISILPGTFREMRSDVHAPEKYGVYQSVGDTAGPGGVLRAMRTNPIYEGFAAAIRAYCPRAWVLNLTNPMSACVKTLYRVFPEIRAFGCCHEVFHAQDLVSMIVNKAVAMAEMMNIPILGVVENMSYVECPDCGKQIFLYGNSHIDSVCEENGIPLLGRIPISPDITHCCDMGLIEEFTGDFLDYAAEAIK